MKINDATPLHEVATVGDLKNYLSEKDIPEVCGVSQAAQFLGLHPGTVYHLVNSGAIPSFRVGKRILIKSEDLRSYAGN